MEIYLNGEKRAFVSDQLTLPDLLKEIGFGEIPVLVEHNGKALHQREFPETVVANGDRIELIRVVAGG